MKKKSANGSSKNHLNYLNEIATQCEVSLKQCAKSVSLTHEVPVYFGDLRKWVKGVDERTTSSDVVAAILAESGIDLQCTREYFIVAESENGKQLKCIEQEEPVLAWWQNISKSGGRLTLTAQRFYANLSNKKSTKYSDKSEFLAKHKLFKRLSEQMDILNRQRGKMANLDDELKRLNSNGNFVFSPNIKHKVMRQFNKLDTILSDQSERMKRCENQINIHHNLTTTSSYDRDKFSLTNELEMAEKMSKKLNDQLQTIKSAEQELDRLLNLKRKHFYDVEQLINHQCENKLSDIPKSTNLRLSKTLLDGECKHRVCFKIGSINTDKTIDFDDIECICVNTGSFHDDDSDTGVSSMNSEESAALPGMSNLQCTQYKFNGENMKSKAKNTTLLETLV